MKKILLTGFEPFGGEKINPSWEAVIRLPSKIGEYEITTLCLPVAFGDATEAVLLAAAEISPDVIICVGQAGGRGCITPELVAINLRHATIPDNKGYQPADEVILSGGDDAYFSTLPMRKIVNAINDSGISATLSYSAGTYVCNDLMYALLHHFKGSKTRVGFIHIPYSTEQNKEPSMDIADIVKGLTVAIESISE